MVNLAMPQADSQEIQDDVKQRESMVSAIKAKQAEPINAKIGHID